MAEIRSTLEMVMERAARMSQETPDETGSEESVRDGMRLAARYMRNEVEDLSGPLQEQKAEDLMNVRKGMIKTFLRNIVLPRGEEQDDINRAFQGLLQLGQEGGDLMAIFSDMKNILDRFIEHRKQLLTQLEEAFSQQMHQMEESMAQQTGMAVKLSPSQHPKFQEEWMRYKGELDNQYGKALDQHKKLVEQRLSL